MTAPALPPLDVPQDGALPPSGGPAPAALRASALQGLPVLVLGLGDSGLAMVRWCLRQGAQVRVWDSREQAPQQAALRALAPQVELRHGSLTAQDLGDARLVLKSPGLAPHDAHIAALLQAAGAAGVPVQGELHLFAAALADLRLQRDYAPRVLAITGTNGKTTTTLLTTLLVQRCGLRAVAAGNVGPSLLDTLMQALHREQADPAGEDADPALPQVWVLELSSFQLHEVQGFEPDAAVVLNLTQDHLDWHGDMAAYAADKARIYGRQAVMVINRDDPQVLAMQPAEAAPAKGVRKSVVPARKAVQFGLDAPQRPGDWGLVQDGGMAWLVRAAEVDPSLKLRRDETAELHLQRLMPVDALRLRGRHNAANALAALALATAIGCPLAAMLHGLREYRGEPHRVELLGLIDGRQVFDDSKGTNVGATVAALRGLGEDLQPARLVVILGGDGKGQDFVPLREPLRQHARAVATLGRDAAAIEAVLEGCDLAWQRHATLEDATRWCYAQSRSGDALLLSPACASLDMFRNYAHRAEVFAATARELAAEHGEPWA
jgi:UDP-N-acetylmuramoylalanine--D-glutamate ligase